MKVVLHWKNIGKAFLLITMAGLIVEFTDPTGYRTLIAMLAGSAAAVVSMAIWELWHFE